MFQSAETGCMVDDLTVMTVPDKLTMCLIANFSSKPMIIHTSKIVTSDCKCAHLMT